MIAIRHERDIVRSEASDGEESDGEEVTITQILVNLNNLLLLDLLKADPFDPTCDYKLACRGGSNFDYRETRKAGNL